MDVAPCKALSDRHAVSARHPTPLTQALRMGSPGAEKAPQGLPHLPLLELSCGPALPLCLMRDVTPRLQDLRGRLALNIC